MPNLLKGVQFKPLWPFGTKIYNFSTIFLGYASELKRSDFVLVRKGNLQRKKIITDKSP